MKRIAFRLPGILLAVVLGASAVMAAPPTSKRYMTAGFQVLKTRPVELVVLPPHAWFLKAQAATTHEMLGETVALERAAADAVAAGLIARGYRARVLTPADVDARPGLRDLLVRLDGRYDEEWNKILARPKDVRQGRYAVGDLGTEVAKAVEADGLVLSRVVAVGFTGGRQAATIILSLGMAYVQSYVRMSLSIVHGSSGRVEAHFEGYEPTRLTALLEEPADVMAEVTRNALKELPGRDVALKPKKKDLKAEEASPEPPAPDEAAMDDFEAALRARSAPAAAPPTESSPPEESPPEESPPEGSQPDPPEGGG